MFQYLPFVFLLLSLQTHAQSFTRSREKSVEELISSYSSAREKQDSVLLSSILTADVDQLVSSGEWRMGIGEATEGMKRSTSVNPGKRTLAVDRIRFPNKNVAIADARYVIENDDGTVRNMWSTFLAVQKKGIWKIAAIRNMLPAR